jgi:hypothetical protein
MKHLFVLIAFCFISIFSITAHAVDMFAFEEPAAGLAKNKNSTLNTAPSAFKAKLNPAALEQEAVVFNLPHKQISAIRQGDVGEVADQISPYAFRGQKGFVAINSKNSELDSVVIFDEEAAEVFRGIPQGDGAILFTQVDIGTFICVNYENNGVSTSQKTADISYYQSLTSLTYKEVTSLQSRPGASKVLYIDYLAGSVSDTAWNTGDGAPETINYANYTYDTDANTFSLIDLQSMYAGWAETAEDYAPFDVNVTTDLSVFNAVAQINKSKIIATSTNWADSGGVAYVDVFGLRDDDFYNIGWTFNKGFSSMGMTHSHESGHQMGLSHDGIINGTPYSPGAGNSGPIMGAPFGKDFAHWNNGSYTGANQTQNDVSIIQGKLGVIADDHGDTNGTSSPIDSEEFVGFISPAGLSPDVDVFRFTLSDSKSVNLTVRSLFAQANNNGSDNTAGGLNLSAKIELKNSANVVVQQKLPSINAAENDFIFSGNLGAGTYYLNIQPQAYEDANFNEYGNGGYYQVQNNLAPMSAPDLLVESPAVDDSILDPGQTFQFSASVKNQGDSTSNATTLTYFRSTDSTINSSDAPVGTDSITSLAADTSAAEKISLTAPQNTGEYYYGACVSAVSGESNTANNCSTGVLITVGSTVDLIVESPAVNDASLESGQRFIFTASVKNEGNTASSSTTLNYYRSSDSTVSASDAPVGTDSVTSLAADTSGAERIRLTAPTNPGEYYYGACVSAVSGESNTANNCSTGVLITVGSTVDLIVESPAVNDASLESGQHFTFTASVKNEGNTASSPTTLNYYRSTDSTINSSDATVGTDSVTSLAADTSAAEKISLTAPQNTGEYYYGACVSAVSGEANTANNCSTGVFVSVTSTIGPDAYEPDNDSTTAKIILNGRKQTHNIYDIGDQDWLTFMISSPAENLVIETSGSAGGDTRVWLYDSDLEELAFNDDDGDDDVGEELYSRIALDTRLPAGTYYILVNEYGNNDAIEGYAISLNFDSDYSQDDPQDEPMCWLIATSNGNMTLICL